MAGDHRNRPRDRALVGIEDGSRLTAHFTGPQRVFEKIGRLTVKSWSVRHLDGPAGWPLVPITATRFRLDEDMKCEFVLEAPGTAAAVRISYRDGRSVTAERSDEGAG